MEMTDKTGQLREPQDFQEARRIVEKRLTSGIPQDIELFMQFTVILEALRIAEIISSSAGKVTPNVELSGPTAGLSPEGRARTQGYASAVKTEEDR